MFFNPPAGFFSVLVAQLHLLAPARVAPGVTSVTRAQKEQRARSIGSVPGSGQQSGPAVTLD